MSTSENANPSISSRNASDLTCGLIMPISLIDGCTADHWGEVKSILIEAVSSIASPKFVTNLVSDADEVGVIQKRIVQNVYNSTIVICDVSGKNPNVMFELGLRLAFDKPTVIVKDDKTEYAFDTGIIEHIGYPRDLRFSKIVDFKKKLADKVLATHNAAINDSDHSPFLKNFGQFQVASLSETVVPADKVIVEMLETLQRDVSLIKRRDRNRVALSTFEARTMLKRALRKYCEAQGIKPSDIAITDAVLRDIATLAASDFGLRNITPSDVFESIASLLHNSDDQS